MKILCQGPALVSLGGYTINWVVYTQEISQRSEGLEVQVHCSGMDGRW